MKSIRPDYPFRPAPIVALFFAWIICSGSASAGKGTLVRIVDGSDVRTGTIVARTPSGYLLMDRQGRLNELDPGRFRQVQKLPTEFQPETNSGFRRELIREFGRDYEVQGTTHYLVCAPSGAARKYAQLFERIYRDVEKFYRMRGFRVSAPKMPLVAVIFSSSREFVDYCRRDNVPSMTTMLGYYSLMTNRVALYEKRSPGVAVGDDPIFDDHGALSHVALATAGGRTASTIIHEATHQVSYNLGIHSRLRGAPKWLVEGLATALEPDGMRKNRAAGERVNQERNDWFHAEYLPRRKPGSLAQMIAADKTFEDNILDGYSEAWALTYFLLDTSSRRRAFSSYLQRLARRDSGLRYTGKQRLADFQAEFGDVARLEVQFLRFMDEL